MAKSEFEVGMHANWETWENGGTYYSGTIIEIDSNVAYVKCIDGKTRAVEVN